MARLEYFLVAESCSIDQITNRVSLFHVLEEANALELPARIPQIVAASAWLKDSDQDENEEDFQVMLTIKGAGLDEHMTTNFQFGDKKRIRIQQTVQNLKLEKPGDIVFEVSLNGKHQASHRLAILKAAEVED